VLGAWSGISGIAIALGPLVGGLLVEYASWHWIFIVNIPVGAALIPAARFRLAESRGPNDKLDIPGVLLASTGLFSLVFALINGNEYGWSSGPELIGFGAGAVLLAAFVLRQHRAAAPMLPLRLFRHRGFSASAALYLMMAFGLFGSMFLLTQFLQGELGYSPLEAGLAMLPAAAMPALTGPLSGPLTQRIGSRSVVMAGLAGQTLALTGLALVVEPTTSYWRLLPWMVLLGLSIGLFFGQISRLVLAAVPVAYEGMASGTGTTFRQMGTVLGVAILGAVFAAQGALTSSQAFIDGLVPALAVAAAVSGTAALVSFLIPAHQTHEPELSKPFPTVEAIVDD
jgi:MFS family permease